MALERMGLPGVASSYLQDLFHPIWKIVFWSNLATPSLRRFVSGFNDDPYGGADSGTFTTIPDNRVDKGLRCLSKLWDHSSCTSVQFFLLYSYFSMKRWLEHEHLKEDVRRIYIHQFSNNGAMKKPWLFRVQKGLYYWVMLGLQLIIRIPIKQPLFHGKSPARFFFCGSPGQLDLKSQLGTSKFFKFISCHQLRRGAESVFRLGWAFGCLESWRCQCVTCQWWLIFWGDSMIFSRKNNCCIFLSQDPLGWVMMIFGETVGLCLFCWLAGCLLRHSEMKTSGIVNLVMRTKKVESPCLITVKKKWEEAAQKES